MQAWAESLGEIHFPLLSDFWPHGEIARLYGVFREDGRSERAIFLVDPQGYIRYIDIHDIEELPSNEVLFSELAKVAVPSASEIEPVPQDESLPKGGVVMYCNAWCPDCRRAKDWLQRHGIAYTEVDIPSTPGAAEQVRAWAGGNLVTPTFDVNGVIVVDFDKDRLSELLL